jgi:cell cycle serine/threonine-protein kinase CDC5/MSD2
MYAMLVGKPPFETKEVKTTYWKIRQTDYFFPSDKDLSLEAKHLIDGILVSNP